MRCQACGSAFLRQHACQAPKLEPECACGHPRNVHHRSDAGNFLYCTVWSLMAPGFAASACGCKRYMG